MSQVLCSLCNCRLDWSAVDQDALNCDVCGHSLDDDHVAAAASASPAELDSTSSPLPIFVGRKVICNTLAAARVFPDTAAGIVPPAGPRKQLEVGGPVPLALNSKSV